MLRKYKKNFDEKRSNVWNNLEKYEKYAERRRRFFGDLSVSLQIKSAVDASLEFIEADRLKELTLLQTFDVR